MSIFGSILSKIFHHGQAEAATSATGVAQDNQQAAAAGPAAADRASGTASSASTGQPVDVEAVLTSMAAKSSQQLNWQTSIVDLMKLLDLDSSLTARKALAGELHYTGDTNDSATMNIWLHRQVMQKLAENGGKVPESLKG